MPKESLSIYLSAIDGISPVFASITDKTRALDKESQELQQTYKALQEANKGLIAQKTELQKKLREVNEEVKAARKQFKELGDEASSDALNKATEKQQALRNEIAGTTKALQENQKIYRENIEIARKNALSGSDGSRGDLTGTRMALGLISGQVGQMLSSSFSGLAEFVAESAFGIPAAEFLSNGISSAISGALAGSVFGVPGAVIGGIAGAGAGLLSGQTKIFKAKDDAFKEYYGGLYEDVKGRSGEMVEAGSTIAGGREQTHMAFSQRLGGDAQADAYLAKVEELAAKTNYEYDEIVGYTKLLLNSYKAETKEEADGTKETDVLDVLMALSDATAGLDLSSSDVNMMISGLSRMRTTGKATQEYLNYFRERGVDVDEALADALGVEKSSIADKVSSGEITGEAAAQAILDFIQKEFGELSEDLAGTYDAMLDNLGDINSSLEAKGGHAYNELRKEGVQAEMNALGGDLGDAIGEINRIMGETQARQENLQEQYMREVLDAVLNGKHGELWGTFDETQQNTLTGMAQKYADLMKRYEGGDVDAGAELGRLYEEAQVFGQAFYDNSDEVARLNEIEKAEIDAIRDVISPLETAHQRLYELNQTLSKGLVVRGIKDFYGSTIAEGEGGEVSLSTAASGYLGAPKAEQDGYNTYSGLYVPYRYRHAFGLERVPYDEYPALLHRDERVLTASEARAQDGGAGAQPLQLTVTGNSFMGVGEELADQLWEIIARKLEQAAVAAAPK